MAQPDKEITGSFGLEQLRQVLEQNYRVAGVPRETSDPENDYQRALELINSGDEMGSWLLDRLVQRGYQPAIRLSELFARAGQDEPAALMDLGRRYETGDELRQDYEQAVNCYVRALHKDELLARPSLERMLKEQRVALYPCLNKYKELRAIDAELTIANRRSALTQEEMDRLYRQRAAELELEAAERQAQFLRRSEMGHTRRLQDENMRTARMTSQAREVMREREKNQRIYRQNQDARSFEFSVLARQRMKAQSESVTRLLMNQEMRGAELNDKAQQVIEQHEQDLNQRFQAMDQRGAELSEKAEQILLQHQQDLDARRAKQDFLMQQQAMLLHDWQQARQEEQEQKESRRREASQEAEALGRMALETNDTRLMHFLADLYHDGTPKISPSPMLYAFWETCIRIVQGEPQILCRVGRKFQQGMEGYVKDDERAFAYYIRAKNCYHIEDVLTQWHRQHENEKCRAGLEEYYDCMEDIEIRAKIAYYVEVGRFCEPDLEWAYALYQECGNQSRAEDVAYRCYQNYRDAKDYAAANDWFQLSGRHKTMLQQQMAARAMQLESGVGNQQMDLPRAYDLYMAADKLGEATRVARALTVAYTEGLYGYAPDRVQAQLWRSRAESVAYYDVM